MDVYDDQSVFDTTPCTAAQFHKDAPTLDQVLAVYDRVLATLDVGAVANVTAKVDPLALEHAVNHRFRLVHSETTVCVQPGPDASTVILAVRNGRVNIYGIGTDFS